MKATIARRTLVIFFACFSIAGQVFGGNEGRALIAADGKQGPLDTPQMSCAGGTQVSRSVTICAPGSATSSTGLPAGFSLQWMTCDAYNENGNEWFNSDDPRLGKASFSGNANSSRYRLDPGECATVNVGDILFDAGASTNSVGNLLCGTCYVFRSFGHATSTFSRSAFTGNVECSTLACDGVGDCTFTFSEWYGIGPECGHGQDKFAFGSFAETWPVTSLTLGAVTYPDTVLTCILGTSANGNGLVALAHQLIAAKLNAAEIGSLPASVEACVQDADVLIGDLAVPPFGSDFLDLSATSALTACLANYNAGAVGPGSCGPIDPGPD